MQWRLNVLGDSAESGIIISEEHKLHDFVIKSDVNENYIEIHTSTHKLPIVLNGFALVNNTLYKAFNDDVLRVPDEDMAYRVRLMNKRFKLDNNTKITSFLHSSSSISMDVNRPLNPEHGWNDFPDCLIYQPPTQDTIDPPIKVAAFDMDGTLIKTKSGQRYAKDTHDWKLFDNSVPKVLQDYHAKNYKLVLFSNQLPLGDDTQKCKEFKIKVDNVRAKLGVPIHCYIAIKRDNLRKPCIGMWTLMESQTDGEINREESFYVGDAAGRPKTLAGPKDHSFADILFARNLNLKFHTPESFFFGRKFTPSPPSFEPKITALQSKFSLASNPEIIVMVGAPASGKSSFCKQNLTTDGYAYVSRDAVGSWQKCVQLVEDALRAKKRVVVDNTNKDKESRKRFIDIAKRMNIPCRCFMMDVDKMRVMHNNKFRQLVDKNHAFISDIIIHSYFKGFEPPEPSEGFDEIVKLKCVPNFEKATDQALYEMFLLDKY